MILSNSCLAAGLEQQREFRTRAPAHSRARRRTLARASRTAGWTICSSAASFAAVGKDDLGEAIAVERAASDGAGEQLADLLDQSAARTLQLRGRRRRRRTPARRRASNIFATVDLPMPIEPVSAIRIMRGSSPRSRSAPSSGNQRHAKNREMIAFDAVEQLHSRGPPAGTRRRYSRPPAIRHRDSRR